MVVVSIHWVASLTIHVVVGPVQDLAIEDMEHWGILRRFDPRQIAMDLISEGKTGWEPDDSKPSTENLSIFFCAIHLAGEISR